MNITDYNIKAYYKIKATAEELYTCEHIDALTNMIHNFITVNKRYFKSKKWLLYDMLRTQKEKINYLYIKNELITLQNTIVQQYQQFIQNGSSKTFEVIGFGKREIIENENYEE